MGNKTIYAILVCIVSCLSISESDFTSYNLTQTPSPKGPLDHTKCRVETIDKTLHKLVIDILRRKAKLVEYHFSVKGYDENPLSSNNKWTYRNHVWSRVGTAHGQTILNLAFNYGVLSLMTLSFGVEQLDIQLKDVPSGCLRELEESKRIEVLLHLTLRDLKEDGDITVVEGESTICYQVIVKTDDNLAKFTDRCCNQPLSTDGLRNLDMKKPPNCFTGIPNKWLQILDVLLAALRTAVFVFGPIAIPGWMYTAVLDTVDYVVHLKEPLLKTICVRRTEEDCAGVSAKHTIDLRCRKGFEKCRKLIKELPSGRVVPIEISKFDIRVNYRKLLPENKVQVGIMECLTRAAFLCKLRELEPFRDCCDADVLGSSTCFGDKEPSRRRTPWINVCNYVGRLMLVMLVPIPFYIRLALYYAFEHPEMRRRNLAASSIGLQQKYSYRMVQYLSPTHPLFLSAYFIYFTAGITLVLFSGKDKKTRFQQVVIDSFVDMKNLSMLKALGLAISNCLCPFKLWGVWGIAVGVVYWPLLMPVSIVVCTIYCLPVVFLTCRIIFHTVKGKKSSHLKDHTTSEKHSFKGVSEKGVQTFSAERLLNICKKSENKRHKKSFICKFECSIRKYVTSILLATMALLTLLSVLLMIAEVIGFIAEVLCFTLMGIIVNASNVLKYGSLIFLVVIYSYDCYNNVNKKYLKLNKDLFSDVKGRLGHDIDEFTSLPSYLQENRGFKACEASQQADYESTDDIAYPLNTEMMAMARAVEEGEAIPPVTSYFWNINDLILFVDSEDNPRIPKKLFDDVCQIRVAGSPGPVYRSLLQATGKFLMIVCFLIFVFIVVLSFGDTYKISSTNQMLATMAGGFMPFIFSNILKPATPLVETKLVSFKGKLEEIIINFWQPWPMDDFTFEIAVPKDASNEENISAHSEMPQDAKHIKVIVTEPSMQSQLTPPLSNDPAALDGGSGIPRAYDTLGMVNSASEYDYNVGPDDDEEVCRLQAALDRLSPLEMADRTSSVDVLLLVSDQDYPWDMSWSTLSRGGRNAAVSGEFDSVSTAAMMTPMSARYNNDTSGRNKAVPFGSGSRPIGVQPSPSPQTGRAFTLTSGAAKPTTSPRKAKPTQRDGNPVQVANRYVGGGRSHNRDRDDADNRSEFSYQGNQS